MGRTRQAEQQKRARQIPENEQGNKYKGNNKPVKGY